MGLFKRMLFSRPFSLNKAGPLIAILALWALVNTFLIACQGIVTTGEAAKYINNARHLLATGHLRSGQFQYYTLIIFLLAFCLKFHLGFAPAIVVQLLFNLAATLYFFGTVLKLLGSQRTALAATILLLLNYPYQAFNTVVQTESLFQSLSLLLSCYLLRKEEIRVKHLGIMALSILVLSLSRPLGLLYIPAVLFYFYLTNLRQKGLSLRLLFLGLSALTFFFFLDRAMGSGGQYDFMLPFREEHIICGTPTLLHPASLQVAENGNSVYALIYYIFHNTGQFLRLAILKTISFWGVYRSYFSPLHNLVFLIYFYPVVLMAIFSLRYWRHRHLSKLAYLLTLILITWCTVVMTCDDWNIRIFLSITPYLILLAAGFIHTRISPSP